MANENMEQAKPVDPKEERKRLNAEKKKLKQEQKEQKKEAKRRAKELALEEANIEDDDDGGGFSVVIVTTIIIIVWLGILALLVKLDVGGFGSNVLAPIISDVPVLNKILPESTETEVTDGESYGGYTNLKDAVDQIEKLELQLEQAQSNMQADSEEIAQLKKEIERLSTFESNQIEFQRIKNEFYEEVIYAENGPGAEEYARYYESMDPETAQSLYKEVIAEEEESKEIKDYAQAYSEMKPKEAAAIFEEMTGDLDLAARILSVMEPDDRGAILGAMDPVIAAKITKIMDPDS
ncbi:MAG: magnesium transporter MgtE N-terminal domain-containing protein [Lachnospiraceae bacterium]